MNGKSMFNHLFILTDDTGMMQHSIGSTPNPKHGYTTDDNARAIIASAMMYEKYKEEKYLNLIKRYLSFLLYAQDEDGHFRNFMAYDRRFIDDDFSEDCFGRCIWTLGYLLNTPLEDRVKLSAIKMIEKSLPIIDDLKYIRGKAYTLIGLYHIYNAETKFKRDFIKGKIAELTDDIIEEYEKSSNGDWKWFEDTVSYDNGIIPLSLLKSFAVLKDEKILDIALESLEFLDSICFRNGYFKAVGCKGWYERGKSIAEYDEQPVEAYTMALMYIDAYKITRNEKYRERALACDEWYYGKNSKRVSLYDESSGGCSDAITEDGVNSNEGAESLISIIISHCATSELR
ncbi:glycosyltransferase [Thermoanaerobacterium sp. CMT5567-10]|uniref:glycosyltransferase n=1 Tax=Thermoanaerobacterium sp. CMT5567-10 TaxID=3061989 RepID=UPI0026DEAC2C|nr:glycosyltransferase [Thermoanaerobacterium sp. CMT5567-10]WKV07658.1 glycosyltransferase [Thermoanaerobacterium sp. CMT5567-10]